MQLCTRARARTLAVRVEHEAKPTRLSRLLAVGPKPALRTRAPRRGNGAGTPPLRAPRARPLLIQLVAPTQTLRNVVVHGHRLLLQCRGSRRGTQWRAQYSRADTLPRSLHPHAAKFELPPAMLPSLAVRATHSLRSRSLWGDRRSRCHGWPGASRRYRAANVGARVRLVTVRPPLSRCDRAACCSRVGKAQGLFSQGPGFSIIHDCVASAARGL